MINIFKIVWFSVCFGWLCLAWPVLAASPAANSPGGGMDIVLVIDQSGSMGGTIKYDHKPNDPYGQRITAVENLVRFLSDSVEGHYHAYGTTPKHQVGIVEFGTKATVALPGEVFEYDPKNLPKRAAVVNRVLSSVRKKDLEFTDHLAALKLAEKLLVKMASNKLPGPRGHLVIMVTDGQPYVTGINLSAYKKRMLVYLHDRFLKRGIALEVLGLDATDIYWEKQRAGDYWNRASGGQARKIANPDDFYEALQKVLLRYISPSGKVVTVEEEFDCPPYIRRIIINVDKNVPGASVIVITPSGKRLNLSSVSQRNHPNYSRYTIDRPEPGIFRFEKLPSQKYCDIQIEVYYSRVVLTHPLRPLRLQEPANLRFKVSSSLGNTFKPDPRFPVKLGVQISSPAEVDLGVMPAKNQGQGVVVTIKPFIPQQYGQYKVRLAGRTRTASGKQVEVFSSQSLPIEVLNKKPVQVKLITPLPDEGWRLFLGEGSFKVEAVLVPLQDPTQILDISQVAQATQRLLAAEVLDRNGQRLAGPVYLHPDKGRLKAMVKVQVPMTSRRWWTIWDDRVWLRLIPNDQGFKKTHYLHSIYGAKKP